MDGSKGAHRGRAGEDASLDDRYAGKGGVFESIEADASGPAQSVEGWIIFITGVHEEASEDDVLDKFAEYGAVRNVTLNLDRRSGFAKGYALIEYGSKKEAEAAIAGMDGKPLLEKEVKVTFAFVNEPPAGVLGGGGRHRDDSRR